jgi:hypothetical protein
MNWVLSKSSRVHDLRQYNVHSSLSRDLFMLSRYAGARFELRCIFCRHFFRSLERKICWHCTVLPNES